MRYRFRKVETVEDVLSAIGRTDIPSVKVTMRKPGEDGSDFEIDFGDVVLSDQDEAKLQSLMMGLGLRLKEKK
jgi:hypothetical protein